MSALPLTPLTPEEYLAIERAAETKHEYYKGQMYAMAGGSHAHALIVANLVGELRQSLKKRHCFVTASDVRLRISEVGLYTYPDLMVICGEPKFADDRKDTVLNPMVIVEVLSKSTEAHDRGFKFAEYRKLESLQEFVLVSQAEARVEKFRRQSGVWVFSELTSMEQVMSFDSVGCSVPMAEIYSNATFSAEENLPPS